ncbi:MAG: NfeD family protein, partial [Cyanobacteria bacterium P01_H01_bin.15]
MPDYPFWWLLAGLLLGFAELLLPSGFVLFALGVGAILVSAIAIFIPILGIQVALWLGFSLVCTLALRRWSERTAAKRSPILEDATEGEMITSIQPGQAGRVLYEGNSWRALCADEAQAIPAKQKVYVVSQTGNT